MSIFPLFPRTNRIVVPRSLRHVVDAVASLFQSLGGALLLHSRRDSIQSGKRSSNSELFFSEEKGSGRLLCLRQRERERERGIKVAIPKSKATVSEGGMRAAAAFCLFSGNIANGSSPLIASSARFQPEEEWMEASKELRGEIEFSFGGFGSVEQNLHFQSKFLSPPVIQSPLFPSMPYDAMQCLCHAFPLS